MDNLTHTLVGLMVSRAGLNRAMPRAALVCALAANAPDCDAILLAAGAGPYFHFHRGYTHSLVFWPLVAVLPVLVARALLWREPFSWRRAYVVSLLAAATHPALDLTNHYGVRLFLPFSEAWYGLDTTAVVDLWIWAALMVATAAPVLSRLVSSEIGAPKTRGRGWAVFALLFLVAYDGTRVLLYERAVAMLQARLYAGVPPRRVAALPEPVNPFRWRGLVETEPAYQVHVVDVRREFDPMQGRTLYKPESVPAMEAARRTAPFQDVLQFTAFPYWRVTPEESAGVTQVELMDLRFARPPRAAFVATATVDQSLRVQRAWFRF